MPPPVAQSRGNDVGTRTSFPGVIAALILVILCAPEDAAAQLNQNCTVSVLNRTVRVNADGTWVLPNIPANTGRIKARATCVQDGVTRFGESDFFTMPRNGIVTLPRIVLGAVTPIPASLVLTPSPVLFNGVGETSQLIATATYPDGSVSNVAAAEHGTDYTTSNSAIVAVSADGLLTAVASGTAVIQAINEGTPGMVTVTVVLSTSDTDGDGIPDDIEVSRGMDPRNPVDAIEDFDRDDLTNVDEYRAGTDLRDPDSDDDDLKDGREVHIVRSNPLFADTDGDDIPDGIEVAHNTNPLNPGSYDLQRAVAVSTLLPPSFLLTTNPVFTGDTFQQLSWIVRLIDGKTVLDLTADPRTSYTSTDLNICSFGAEPGRVFAGQPGTCQISIRNSTLTVVVSGTITRFTPTAISALPIPGFANSVDVVGDFAYVAAGSQGLQIVDVSNRVQPAIVASRALPGNANDVVVVNQRAYVAAGSAGLQIVDVSNPLAPALLGSIATGNVAWDVVVRNGRAYVASGTAGLKVIDVSNPSVPVQLGALALTGTTKGVDVDVARSIAVVARGIGGISIVDVQNPAAPAVIGDLAGGDVRDVAISGSHVLLADFDRSMTAVDVTNPAAPMLTSSTPRDTGGLLQDVSVFGSLAAGADVFFVNGVPLFDVADAANPLPKAIVDFRLFRDDEGTGVALDSAFVYLTAGVAAVIENGVSSTRSALYIGQYRSDDQTPPVVTIQSPAPNHSALEGSTLPVAVDATDNFAVASVRVLVNGQLQATTQTPPYQLSIPVPVGETSMVLSAEAVDFAGNRGTSSDVPVIIVRDTDRPTVQLTAPTAPLTVPEGTVIQTTATASDNVVVTRVEFLLNDVIVATRTSAPYEAFITLPIGPTTFRFSARAFDPAGNAGTAAEVVVNVTTDPPPTVAIVMPASGTTILEGSIVTLVIEATDNGAVISTELTGLVDGKEIFRQPTNLGTSQLGTPIGITELTLVASATDNLGQVGTSQPVVLNIEPEPAPTVSFVTPLEGDTLVGGSTIRVVLDAADDVAVSGVVLEGTAGLSSPPYEFDVFVPAGLATLAANLELRGTAVDDVGKTTSVALSLPVAHDPLTTLQGVVTDVNGTVIEGATVLASSLGLTAELFRVTSELTELPDTIAGTADATRVVSAPSMIYPEVDPFGFIALVPDLRDTAQALIRLRGTLNVPAAGVYDFRMVAFPAGRLTVNGARIIDLWSVDNATVQGSSTATLPAGVVPIEIVTVAAHSTSQIRLEWGPEGGQLQSIPLDALAPAESPYRSVTGPDGTFTIENVPTVLGDYVVSATVITDGVALSGSSAPTAPVPGAFADVGTIEVSPTLDPVAIPVSYTFVSGSPRGIHIHGDAYIASGPAGLARVRVGNPENPFTPEPMLPLPGEANDVRVDGYAFVAAGAAGLHVVLPGASFLQPMQLVTTLPLGGDALRLALPFDDQTNDRIYVANGPAGLAIVDISTPTAPAVLGATPIPGGASAITFYGDHNVAVVGGGGLTLVDVANPASPVVLGTLPIANAHAVAVRGDTALVGTATVLIGVDIGNPQALQTIFEQPGPVGDVRMAGTLAAIGQRTPTSVRASFVDLRDRERPATVKSIDFDVFSETLEASQVTAVTTDGPFVYVVGTLDPATDEGFLVIGQYNQPIDPFGAAPIILSSNIFDGAEPLNQNREAEVDVLVGAFDDVAIASVKIFVNDQLVLTRTTPSSQEWGGTLAAPIPIGASSVTVRLEVTDVGGNVSSRTATLAVNPFVPTAFGAIGSYAFLPGDMASDGKSIWITDPENTNFFTVQRWLANGDLKFSSGSTGPRRSTFAAVDAAENGWIALNNDTVVVLGTLGDLIRTLNVPSPGRLFFDGTHMWVVSGSLLLKKIDAQTFVEVGSFFTGGVNPGLMASDGSHLWVVNHGSQNIAKIRPSDGAVLGTIPVSANVTGVAFDGTNLWIVNGSDNTVSIVRAADSITVATIPTGSAPAGIAVDGAFMYVTNSGDNNATKFRVADRVALATIFTGQQPTKILTAGGYMWVLNAGSRSIFLYRLR